MLRGHGHQARIPASPGPYGPSEDSRCASVTLCRTRLGTSSRTCRAVAVPLTSVSSFVRTAPKPITERITALPLNCIHRLRPVRYAWFHGHPVLSFPPPRLLLWCSDHRRHLGPRRKGFHFSVALSALRPVPSSEIANVRLAMCLIQSVTLACFPMNAAALETHGTGALSQRVATLTPVRSAICRGNCKRLRASNGTRAN